MNSIVEKLKLNEPWVAIPILLVVSVLLYSVTFNHKFTNWDDPGLVLENRFIRHMDADSIVRMFVPGKVGSYQPVRTFSYALDFWLWKLDPKGYHEENVLWFALNVLGVYLLVKALFNDAVLGLVTALFFAVHPIHVEGVAWVSGRKEVLSGAFFFFSLYLYVQYRNKEQTEDTATWMAAQRRYYAALVLSLLAVFSKSSAVILPVILLCYEICFHKEEFGRDAKTHLSRYGAFFLGPIFVGLTTIWVVEAAGGVFPYPGGNVYTTLLTMSRVLWREIWLLFVPTKLIASYQIYPATTLFSPITFLAVIGVLGLVALTVILYRKAPRWAFCFLWFGVALIPTSNIVPISTQLADRYLYLASFAYCLFLALCLRELWSRAGSSIQRGAVGAAGFSAIVAYGILAVIQCGFWHDSIRLWERSVSVAPTGRLALTNLGVAYAQELGDHKRAIEKYNESLKIDPTLSRTYANMASSYCDMGDFDSAEQGFKKALELEPDVSGYHHGLGIVLERKGQMDEAKKEFERALELDPFNVVALEAIGKRFYVEGKFLPAAERFMKAVYARPEVAKYFDLLGNSYQKAGNQAMDDVQKRNKYLSEAIQAHMEAVKLEENNPEFHYNLGNAFVAIRATQRAIGHYLKAIELDPNSAHAADYHANLGSAYVQAGKAGEGLTELQKALEIGPEMNPSLTYMVKFNMASADFELGRDEEAYTILKELLEKEPGLAPNVQLLLGKQAERKKDKETARRHYQEALRLNPNFSAASLALEQLNANQ